MIKSIDNFTYVLELVLGIYLLRGRFDDIIHGRHRRSATTKTVKNIIE